FVGTPMKDTSITPVSLARSAIAVAMASGFATGTDNCSEEPHAADAFAAKFKGDLIYCDDKGWFLREKQIFEPLSPANVQGLTKGFVEEEVEKVTAGPVAYSPLKGCLTRTRINAVIELSRAQLYVQPSSLDENRDLAGCSDGHVLDLNTGTLIRDETNSI